MKYMIEEDPKALNAPLLRAIFDSLPLAVLIHDLDGRIVDVNERMLEMYRVDRTAAFEFSIEHGYSGPKAPLESLPELWRRAVAGETQDFAWEALRPLDGSTFEVDVHLERIYVANQNLILASIRDVTEDRAALNNLRRARKRFEDVAYASGDWIWETDRKGKLTYVSPRVEAYLGYTPDALSGRHLYSLLCPQELPAVRAHIGPLVRARHPIIDHESRYLSLGGARGYSLMNAVPKFDDVGIFDGYLGVVKDITERRNAEQQLRLFQRVVESAIEGIVITNKDAEIIAVNPAFTTITGYTANEVIGNTPRLLKSEHHDSEFYHHMWHSLLHEGQWSGEIWNRRKSGESYPEWLSISAITDHEQGPTHFVGVFHDITDSKLKEDHIRFQALHDALTGLPNRVLFYDRLHVAIQHAHRDGTELGVLFFDLDNFKNINDTLGHSVGDTLLQEVAVRVTTLVRSEDTIARLGGDEFVVLVKESPRLDIAVSVAQRIRESLNKVFQIREHEFFVSTSIGISHYPKDGTEPESLIKRADLAMYQAKSGGRDGYRLYRPEMDAGASERLLLESQLRRAVDEHVLTVVFQPKLHLTSGKVRGAEALVRWRNSEGHMVSPADFIPIAEQSGLISRLDEHVLRTSCHHIVPLLQSGFSDLHISVNLSARHVGQSDVVARILAILDETGLPPENLELEITETTLLDEFERVARKLRALADSGVQISIDDFGTGYSSFYYLKKLPIHRIKIDQSFVRELTVDNDDAEIVSSMLAMAHGLGLEVVAEGVETKEQLEFLAARDCEEIQGYYYSRPLAPEAFTAFLSAQS
ncbi:MAG: EAL domain-containing protein [Spirochaetaceae bacterium]|nr:MAG: EAL domain-containing protein [Spirochaetaceae bacterium]